MMFCDVICYHIIWYYIILYLFYIHLIFTVQMKLSPGRLMLRRRSPRPGLEMIRREPEDEQREVREREEGTSSDFKTKGVSTH